MAYNLPDSRASSLGSSGSEYVVSSIENTPAEGVKVQAKADGCRSETRGRGRGVEGNEDIDLSIYSMSMALAPL